MRKIIALVALAAAMACGGSDSSTGTITTSVAGTYTLKTVNGASLPATTQNESTFKAEVLSGSYTLTAAGTFTGTVTSRITSATGSTSTPVSNFAGTYTATASGVHFTDTSSSSPHSFDMAFTNSNTLTLSEAGYTYVYQR